MANIKYDLFKFFAEEHNLILTDSEMNDIIHAVTQVQAEQKQLSDEEQYEDAAEEIDCLKSEIQSYQKIIKELEAALQTNVGVDGWIDVKDEKPTVYTPVLLCFEKESKGMFPIQSVGYWCGDSFISDKTPLFTKKITHWQPLPQPFIWIDVNDKKPPKAKPIMIYNGHWIGVGYYKKNYKLKIEGEPKWSDETGEYITPNPTHWQLLPPPPINNKNK